MSTPTQQWLFFWHRDNEKMTCFWYSKTMDTKSKCQYDNEDRPSKKQSNWRWLDFDIQKKSINDTHSQGYQCQTKITVRNISTGISLLNDYFVQVCPCWLAMLNRNILTHWLVCTGISFTDWLFCTGISLLIDYFVLEYPYWLIVLHWNNLYRLTILYRYILTDWLFCTGISLPTAIL